MAVVNFAVDGRNEGSQVALNDKGLVTADRKSVEEIAELCGYHHTEHFIRQFKKKMNKTPLQYKKQQLDRE